VKTLSLLLLEHANALAQKINAKAVVIYADALEGESDLLEALATVKFPTILFSFRAPARHQRHPKPVGRHGFGSKASILRARDRHVLPCSFVSHAEYFVAVTALCA
jgi:hypothetical protein